MSLIQTQLKQSQRVTLSLVALTIIGVGAASVISGLFAALLGMQTIVKDNTQLGTAYLVGGPCIENVTQQFAATNNYLWASPQQFQRGDFSFCDTSSEVFTTQTYFRSYYDDDNPCEDPSSDECANFCQDIGEEVRREGGGQISDPELQAAAAKCIAACDDTAWTDACAWFCSAVGTGSNFATQCGNQCDSGHGGDATSMECGVFCSVHPEDSRCDNICQNENATGEGCTIFCSDNPADPRCGDGCDITPTPDSCLEYCFETRDASACCKVSSSEACMFSCIDSFSQNGPYCCSGENNTACTLHCGGNSVDLDDCCGVNGNDSACSRACSSDTGYLPDVSRAITCCAGGGCEEYCRSTGDIDYCCNIEQSDASCKEACEGFTGHGEFPDRCGDLLGF